MKKFPMRGRTVTLGTPSEMEVSHQVLHELFAVAALVLALAIPGGRQDVFHATEMAAVRDLQIITSVQTQYLSQFGRYAASMAELGAANLIPASLALGRKGGYAFRIATTQEGYSLNARPLVFGKTGKRTFYGDQSMVIRENWGPEAAGANSPEFK